MGDLPVSFSHWCPLPALTACEILPRQLSLPHFRQEEEEEEEKASRGSVAGWLMLWIVNPAARVGPEHDRVKDHS